MGQLVFRKKQKRRTTEKGTKRTKKYLASPFHTLERIVRGFSNHRRIEILALLEVRPEQSVVDIADSLHINFKTAAAHVQRLAIAGLILKRNAGAAVRHRLTMRGEYVLKFLRTLE